MSSASQSTLLLSKFKNTLIGFVDELVQLFPSDPDIVMCRILVKDQIPIQVIMSKFRDSFMPYRDMITSKDPLFFTAGTCDFCTSLKLTSNIFEKVWYSPTIDDETRDTIWQWITSLFRIMEKYDAMSSSAT